MVKSAAPTGFPQNDYTYFTTSLTGGDVTYTGSVYVLTFKSSGSLVFKTGVTLPTTVNYLLVGGGGSGSVGGASGGGGGAGGSVVQLQAGGSGAISISDLTKTITFTVATSVAGPNVGAYNINGFDGNPTSAAITGGSTYTAAGGRGGNSDGTGAFGSNGGGSGGSTGLLPGNTGSNGTTVSIRSVSYIFGGGGSGGNQYFSQPIGGLGGGGGAGSGANGNNGVAYNRPNGVSQTGGAPGFANSGGGGAGGNVNNTFSARAGGSGIAIVWFTYP